MKTSNTISLAIAMFTFALAATDRAQAQGSSKDALIASLPTGALHVKLANDPSITYQLVDRSYAPTKYSPDVMLREVMREGNGSFNVRVIDANGQVRMTGHYLDAGITMADGTFSYYYENGELESNGLYLRGSKSGVWERHARDGSRLADRMYLGLDGDQLQVALGLATQACTRDEEVAAQR